jgi:hypothetical protein
LDGSFRYSSCPAAQAQCEFNGRTIASGMSVTAYLASSVPAGTACTSQTRSCLNGVLSGGYVYASCSAGAKAACLFDGKTIPDGGKVYAFQSGKAMNGSCTGEVRTCDNGALTGSFTFGSCTSGTSSPCAFDGKTIPDSDYVAAFRSSSELAGASACTATMRVCNGGSLSGDAMATFGSCSIVQPMDCTLDGTTVKHGTSAVAYSARTVPYGQSCVFSQQTRSCNNGALSGTYPYTTCTVDPPPDCPPIGNFSLKHNQYIMTSQNSTWFFTLGPDIIMNARFCNSGELWKTMVWVKRTDAQSLHMGVGIVYTEGSPQLNGLSYIRKVTDFSGADIPSPIYFYSGQQMALLPE